MILGSVKTENLDLNKDEYVQQKYKYLHESLGNRKKDSCDNPMKVTLDTGAALHVCPLWFGERFPLTETTQKVTPASRADIKGLGRRSLPLMFEESPGCCFMATFLVCDVTTLLRSFSQLLQQGCGRTADKDSMHLFLDEHFKIPTVQQGKHSFIEPTSFWDDYSEQPCAARPVYSDKLAMVSQAFARSSMKWAP